MGAAIYRCVTCRRLIETAGNCRRCAELVRLREIRADHGIRHRQMYAEIRHHQVAEFGSGFPERFAEGNRRYSLFVDVDGDLCWCCVHERFGVGWILENRGGKARVRFYLDGKPTIRRMESAGLRRSDKHIPSCPHSSGFRPSAGSSIGEEEAPIVTTGILFTVVKRLVTRIDANPIASSDEVKAELSLAGIVFTREGRNGGHLEDADRGVARDGRLARWKSGRTAQDTVGWSLSARVDVEQHARATQWAEQRGWHTEYLR